MFEKNGSEFWMALDMLVASGTMIVDRPKGSYHPRYPEIRYELDYGYLDNTVSMDGDGIDVWRGSLLQGVVNAIVCTVDLVKRDSEIKLLVGCTEEEMNAVCAFHNRTEGMKGILVKRD